MKGMRTFIIAIVILFVSMMFIEMATPKHFTWKPTFTHNDDEPFGSALFDSVMVASLPQGYTTTTLTLSQLETAIPAAEHHVYLITTQGQPLSISDEAALMSMLMRGDQFLVASGSWNSDTIEQVMGFRVYGYDYPWVRLLKSNVLEKDLDTLTWVNKGTQYATRDWCVPNEITDAFITIKKPGLFKTLVVKEDYQEDFEYWDEDADDYKIEPVHIEKDTIAGVVKLRDGRLLVAACPMLFTNYGVIECDAAPLVLRMLSQLEHYPVIRLDPQAKTEAGGVSESPLRYVLSQPPMKWAVWLMLLAVVLAMFFTARRRQRVIPVIKPPVNRSLEMVKHIGSLYFHRHDNADLLAKKYQFFVEEVRKLTMIDLNDENHIDDAYLQLQHQSGIPRDELKQQLQSIVGWTNEQPSDRTLMRCIDYLNLVLSKLK